MPMIPKASIKQALVTELSYLIADPLCEVTLIVLTISAGLVDLSTRRCADTASSSQSLLEADKCLTTLTPFKQV